MIYKVSTMSRVPDSFRLPSHLIVVGVGWTSVKSSHQMPDFHKPERDRYQLKDLVLYRVKIFHCWTMYPQTLYVELEMCFGFRLIIVRSFWQSKADLFRCTKQCFANWIMRQIFLQVLWCYRDELSFNFQSPSPCTRA